MADRVLPGPVAESANIREAVSIHTRKIFDSCRDKDCVEDLRVYPTVSSQAYIEGAFSIRPRSAELLYADVEVEEISFNRGYFTVDVKYFYRVRGVVFPGAYEVSGLAVFDKRVILFGSESSAKTFTSDRPNFISINNMTNTANLPTAVCEAVNPIALNMKIVEARFSTIPENELRDIPEYIGAMFGEEIVLTNCTRRVYCTLGQFSIIRLERDTQLLIPVYDYCVPERECDGASDDDPCSLFGRIRFPIEEFFPPNSVDIQDDYRGVLRSLN